MPKILWWGWEKTQRPSIYRDFETFFSPPEICGKMSQIFFAMKSAVEFVFEFFSMKSALEGGQNGGQFFSNEISSGNCF